MAKKAVEKKEIVNLGHGTGRRKTSVARVYLREGNGKITVNGKPVDEYFVDAISVYTVKQPLVLTETSDKYDVLINVVGGRKKYGRRGARRRFQFSKR